MGIFAVVQEDPRPVFIIPDACVDVGRLKIKLPGADNELVLAYDYHRRHDHPQGAMFKLADEIVSWCDTKLAGVVGSCHSVRQAPYHWLASATRSLTLFAIFGHSRQQPDYL